MTISGVKNFIKGTSVYKSVQKAVTNAEQKFYNTIPDRVFGEKGDKFFKTVGREISSAENRLILGITALASQPFIDYHNRNIDDETRKVAVCRTVAKIIAGTLTGFAVRKGTIGLIKACSKKPAQNVPKWRSFFVPKDVKNVDTESFTQYQNAIGTFISLGVMLITNFAIDAPLTKFLTNKFTDNLDKKNNSGGVK